MRDIQLSEVIQLTFLYFKKVFMHFTIYSMIILTLVLISNSLHPYAGLLFQFAVWPLLLAGYFLYLKENLKALPTPISTFFQGSNYLIPLVIVNATKLIVFSLLFLPYTGKYTPLLQEFMLTRNVALQAEIFLSLRSPEFLLASLGTIILLYLTSLAVPYVLFHDMRPYKALAMSAKKTSKIFVKGFLLFVFLLVLSGVGILIFGVGIFLTIGIYFCGIFALYICLNLDKSQTVIEDSIEPQIRIE